MTRPSKDLVDEVLDKHKLECDPDYNAECTLAAEVRALRADLQVTEATWTHFERASTKALVTIEKLREEKSDVEGGMRSVSQALTKKAEECRRLREEQAWLVEAYALQGETITRLSAALGRVQTLADDGERHHHLTLPPTRAIHAFVLVTDLCDAIEGVE